MFNFSVLQFGETSRLRLRSIFRIPVLLFIGTLMAGCSRQPPPPPPPPPTPSAPAAQAPEPAAPKAETAAELSSEERVQAVAKNKFSLYERKIKVADFPRAEAALRDLRAAFDMESEYKNFWDGSVPPSKRIVLTLMSLCETCKDGKCSTCKGKAKCEVCGGSGKCGTCDGRPVRYQACKACVCRACTGTGKCRTCGAFKQRACEACSGHGTVSSSAAADCARCGSTGHIQGLKGPSGTSTQLMCLTCKGSGRIPTRVLNACAACGGKGVLPCASCQGNGRCASCAGSGRTPSCASCGGTGQTVHNCPQCNGDGKCLNCEGNGLCPTCRGSGKCFECSGGLVSIYDLPVSTEWMTMREGYAFYDSKIRKLVEAEEKAGYKEIKYGDLNLSLVINPGQLVFIATQPAFDPAIEIIRK